MTQTSKRMANGKLNRAKAIWRSGRVTKPDYQHFCNQLHLHQQLVNQGSMEADDFRIAIETLMEQLTKSPSKNTDRPCPNQRTNAVERKRHNPPGGRTLRNPKPKERGCIGKGKKGERTDIIVLGGARIRKRYNKWQQIRRMRWDSLLNVKQSAESVAEGAAQITLTTQRMMPAPRRKKKLTEVCGF